MFDGLANIFYKESNIKLLCMHTLVLAENTRKASFVKKGLQYENLSADIFTYYQLEEIRNAIFKIDGLFLLLHDALGKDLILEIITMCRNFKPLLPIILLGHGNLDPTFALFFQNEINAYYSYPFPFRNISFEMRYAIFKMKEDISNSRLVFRDLELDVGSHQVKYKNETIYLRHKEFSLLHFLMLNKGRVLSRNTILENVWDRNANIFTNTVDVHVSQLRKKLEHQTDQKYIHTIPCTGYIFE